MEQQSDKLWGGRFVGGVDKTLNSFQSSLPFDIVMWREDITASIAHVKMLRSCDILDAEDAEKIAATLEEIMCEWAATNGPTVTDDEDIHSLVEATLKGKIGALAGKLHTARSRNDQVATDFRLFLRNKVDALSEQVKELESALLASAKTHFGIVMPGFTHLQHAQPILVSHHLLAYFWMLERDKARLTNARKMINRLPLGAAALAGTSFKIDRELVAKELGFEGVIENSLDAVSDRDFVAETIFVCSTIMMHLSRLSEEIILWSSQEFGWVDLPEGYYTGSSIMPQKKNPDGAELIRGKSGRVFGDLIGILTVLKGLPLAYNKDLQEDKESAFDAINTTTACLKVMTGMIFGIVFKEKSIMSAFAFDMSSATEIADYLANKGVPFRDAHHISGESVLFAEKAGKGLDELTLAELKQFSDLLDEDILPKLKPKSVADAKTSYGGTNSDRVLEQIAEAEKALQ